MDEDYGFGFLLVKPLECDARIFYSCHFKPLLAYVEEGEFDFKFPVGRTYRRGAIYKAV